MESELKKLENNLESSNKLRKYESLKIHLELIYDHIEKPQDNQNRIRKLIVNKKEINNET